jgi:uncharacterized membrane protein HdeD (DUF308 family)
MVVICLKYDSIISNVTTASPRGTPGASVRLRGVPRCGVVSMHKALTRSARFLGVGGVASILLGAMVLVWPGISLAALTALFGSFASVYGAFGLAAGLTLLAHKSSEWVPYVVVGAAGVLTGVVTFPHPAVTVLALTYLIAAWAFAVGAFEIMGAVRSEEPSGSPSTVCCRSCLECSSQSGPEPACSQSCG